MKKILAHEPNQIQLYSHLVINLHCFQRKKMSSAICCFFLGGGNDSGSLARGEEGRKILRHRICYLGGCLQRNPCICSPWKIINKVSSLISKQRPVKLTQIPLGAFTWKWYSCQNAPRSTLIKGLLSKASRVQLNPWPWVIDSSLVDNNLRP